MRSIRIKQRTIERQYKNYKIVQYLQFTFTYIYFKYVNDDCQIFL